MPASSRTLAVGDTLTYDQLIDYYSQLNDYIVPYDIAKIKQLIADGKLPGEFVVKSDHFWKNRLAPVGNRWNDFASDEFYFKTDVKKYNEHWQGEDLLDAKLMHFVPLFMAKDKDDPSLRLDFFPLSYWTSLGHPPITKLELPLDAYYKEFKEFDIDAVESDLFSADLQEEIDRTSNTELTYGNKLRLLPNNSAFVEKLRMARTAKKSFHVAVLYFKCDDYTMPLIDEMIAAKARGVDVRFMSEGAFQIVESPCIKKMRKGGVEVIGISDVFKKDSRFGVMHNKLWIKDNEEAIIGGQNLMEAENAATGFNHLDRDTDLLVESGPMVADVVYGYAGLWEKYRANTIVKRTTFPDRTDMLADLRWAEQEKAKQRAAGLRGADYYDQWLNDKKTRMNGICRVAVQDAGADNVSIAKIIYKLLEKSKSNYIFTTPTVDYDKDAKDENISLMNNQLASMIKTKAYNGLKVEIITNSFDGGNGELTIIFRNLMNKAKERNHKLLAKFYERLLYLSSKKQAFSFVENLYDMIKVKNIRAWSYFQYTHSKLQFFDRIVSSVGSWNFDINSSELSHETQAFCFDRGLRDDLEKQLTLDLSNSIPVLDLHKKN